MRLGFMSSGSFSFCAPSSTLLLIATGAFGHLAIGAINAILDLLGVSLARFVVHTSLLLACLLRLVLAFSLAGTSPLLFESRGRLIVFRWPTVEPCPIGILWRAHEAECTSSNVKEM